MMDDFKERRIPMFKKIAWSRWLQGMYRARGAIHSHLYI